MGYAGHMTWQRFDWESAERGFRTAIELNPSYAEARMFYSHYLALMGQLEESSEQMAIALELDPFDRNIVVNGGQILAALNNETDARIIYSSFLERYPDDEEVTRLLKRFLSSSG